MPHLATENPPQAQLSIFGRRRQKVLTVSSRPDSLRPGLQKSEEENGEKVESGTRDEGCRCRS